MIYEQEVLSALPSRGWLHDYVLWAKEQCAAHMVYHVACGLSLLSQTLPPNAYIPVGNRVRGNLYSLLIGESAIGSKGLAIGIARDVLRQAGIDEGPKPGSKEALMDGLIMLPRQLLVYDEFGAFLASAEGGYFNQIKTELNDLYDCVPVSRAVVENYRAKKQKDKNGIVVEQPVQRPVSVENPRLSILCGCAPGYLSRHTEPVDWTSGFFSRFMTFWADPEREMDLPLYDEQGRVYLATRLREMWIKHDDITTPWAPCASFDVEAQVMWSSWRARTRSQVFSTAAEEVRGAVDRAGIMALKIALLLAWDYGSSRGVLTSWKLTSEFLAPAIAIAGWHIDSVLRLGTQLASGRDMRDRQAVLNAISSTDPTSFSTVLLKAKILKKRALEILDSLKTEGTIVNVLGSSQTAEHFLRRNRTVVVTEAFDNVVPLRPIPTLVIDQFPDPELGSPEA